MREMILEYFSLEVTPTGELVSIPLLVRGYTPPLAKLPLFLLRLGPHVVDWEAEKECLDSIMRELASFYVPEQLPPPQPASRSGPRNDGGGGGDDDGGEGGGIGDVAEGGQDYDIEKRRREIHWAVEHIFFPAFKARLIATNTLMQSGVLEVANLKGLYRVFERC
ncbi:hypothetical protein MAPG_00962 [Magnaporthiopsis poae ATCC 64411]|uniref:DNA mismatch repair protein Mlh1 C-terminal domain-containing protein n=1 Tax=Magnaporthiopsis poae (strain ATCC 64411 / 73-15) TaxID=644358 RepID=A0A0C4DMF6_MAGP6|nr:hypothetical protein MAPG_00962 [Magnaporthiopsis poae ATCC 64411]